MELKELSLQAIRSLEEQFRKEDKYGDSTLEPIREIKGQSPVLVTGIHTVKGTNLKSGSDKDNEVYTGAIVLATQQFTGCHAMIRQNNNGGTPVVFEEFKERMIDYIKGHDIKFVVDIHGAVAKDEWDIAPGDNEGKHLGKDVEFFRGICTESFEKYGITKISFNTKFQAATPATLAHIARTQGNIRSTQLEISKRFREPATDLLAFNALLGSISTYVDELAKVDYEEKDKSSGFGL